MCEFGSINLPRFSAPLETGDQPPGHDWSRAKCLGLQATVNPKNNLAHCFSYGENTNNIDLMMLQGHDFLGAVRLLKNWLEQYRHGLGLPTQSVTPRPSQDK